MYKNLRWQKLHWYCRQQTRRNAHYITIPDTLWSGSLEFSNNKSYYYKHMVWSTRWRSWLRYCATSRKVAGSIPDGVIEIFHWHNPSDRTMAVGSTQPLTEMSYQEYFLAVIGGRCVRLPTLPPSCADCLKIWKPQLPGILWPCPGQ